MKYTYKDIIIAPNDERLRGHRNQEFFYGNFPLTLLERVNSSANTQRAQKLEAIRTPADYPFKISGKWFLCLILKKEPEVKYIPFDLSKKEDRDFLRGKWVKLKSEKIPDEFQLTSFNCECDGTWSYLLHSAEYLFEKCTFLDGSPVGKKEEE